jgi:hypothetical protein
MNPVIGMLVIVSGLILMFLTPIVLSYFMSLFFPAKLEPVSSSVKIDSTSKQMDEPLGFSINVKKIKKDGNIIWVDAEDPQH